MEKTRVRACIWLCVCSFILLHNETVPQCLPTTHTPAKKKPRASCIGTNTGNKQTTEATNQTKNTNKKTPTQEKTPKNEHHVSETPAFQPPFQLAPSTWLPLASPRHTALSGGQGLQREQGGSSRAMSRSRVCEKQGRINGGINLPNDRAALLPGGCE